MRSSVFTRAASAETTTELAKSAPQLATHVHVGSPNRRDRISKETYEKFRIASRHTFSAAC